MAGLRGLLRSLVKSKGKRSLGHTIPGYAGQCDTARPATRAHGGRQSTPSVSRQKDYMSGLPEDYVPHPGFMESSEGDYTPYDGHIAESIPHSGQFPPRPANRTAFRRPESVDYEDCLMEEKFFEQQMGFQDNQSGAPNMGDYAEAESAVGAPNTNNFPSLEDLTDALTQLQQVLPDDHPVILRLSVAIQAMTYNTSMPQTEDPNGALSMSEAGVAQDPLDIDPYQEAEQIFNQQMQQLEMPFEVPDFDGQSSEMQSEQAMFEQPMSDAGLAMDSAPESLDDIVDVFGMPCENAMYDGMPGGEAYNGGPMPPDLFGPEMTEAIDQMGPADPYMAESQPDDMTQQEMHDEQMPDSMDPDMMPGAHGT